MGSHRVLAFAADSDRTVMTGTGLCYTLNTAREVYAIIAGEFWWKYLQGKYEN